MELPRQEGITRLEVDKCLLNQEKREHLKAEKFLCNCPLATFYSTGMLRHSLDTWEGE